MLIIENMGSTDKDKVLNDAIDNGYTVTFFYAGKDYEERKKRGENPVANYRRVEPFALGKTKDGAPVLRAFQYKGATNTKNGVYKMFRLDQIKGDIKYVYDGDGKTIRSFEPRKYIEKRQYKDGTTRNVQASYRDNGSDKHMGGGVNNYFDVDRENLVGIPSMEPTPNEPVKKEPNQKFVIKPTEPIKPEKQPVAVQPKNPVPTPAVKQPQQQTNIKNNEPVQNDMAKLDKVKQRQNSYDELDESYSSGFLKWIIKLYE